MFEKVPSDAEVWKSQVGTKKGCREICVECRERDYHLYAACVAKMLAAADAAHSLSSYGGVGHCGLTGFFCCGAWGGIVMGLEGV